MNPAGERAGARWGVWRAFMDAAKTRLRRNRPTPPARTRLTQGQVEEWKQQRRAGLGPAETHSPFRNADASGLNLSGFAWTEEDFTNCDLRGANLSGCDFTGAKFEGADLWNADLSGSDLTGVTTLLPEQLAATNLQRAKLSEPLTKFEALEASAKLADNASKVFLTMLSAVAFTFLTLATAKDWQLVTNGINTKLPVINSDVAIRDFCCIIPVVLLALFIYFHIYLQRLWEALVTLPAVFPDGRRLDERSHPWLLTDLVRRHLPRLQTKSVALSGLQSGVSMVLGYWIVPITVIVTLWRLVALHNWWIIGIQLLTLAVGTGFGFCFLGNRWKTFRDQPEKFGRMPHFFHYLSVGQGIPAGLVTGLLGLAFFLSVTLQGTHANLRNVDFHGANLRATNLSSADLQGADLEGAVLKGANLKGTILRGADLTDAHLLRAHLEGAHLEGAILRGADFENAYLQEAHLNLVHFQNAHLVRADLEGADLRAADLKHAQLEGARLEETDLREAVLEGADLRGADLRAADLEAADLKDVDLQQVNLQHANLQDADLQDADLEGAVVSDRNDLKGAKGTYKGKVVVKKDEAAASGTTDGK